MLHPPTDAAILTGCLTTADPVLTIVLIDKIAAVELIFVFVARKNLLKSGSESRQQNSLRQAIFFFTWENRTM